MPSLLILLIFGAILAVTNAGSFFYGQHVQEAEDKAAQLTAITQAVDNANKQAKADLDAAVIAADRAAKAKTRSAVIKGKAIEAIREEPSPASCDWTPDAWSVLNDAIQSANDNPIASSSLPQPMPRIGTASKPKR